MDIQANRRIHGTEPWTQTAERGRQRRRTSDTKSLRHTNRQTGKHTDIKDARGLMFAETEAYSTK